MAVKSAAMMRLTMITLVTLTFSGLYSNEAGYCVPMRRDPPTP